MWLNLVAGSDVSVPGSLIAEGVLHCSRYSATARSACARAWKGLHCSRYSAPPHRLDAQSLQNYSIWDYSTRELARFAPFGRAVVAEQPAARAAVMAPPVDREGPPARLAHLRAVVALEVRAHRAPPTARPRRRIVRRRRPRRTADSLLDLELKISTIVQALSGGTRWTNALRRFSSQNLYHFQLCYYRAAVDLWCIKPIGRPFSHDGDN